MEDCQFQWEKFKREKKETRLILGGGREIFRGWITDSHHPAQYYGIHGLNITTESYWFSLRNPVINNPFISNKDRMEHKWEIDNIEREEGGRTLQGRGRRHQRGVSISVLKDNCQCHCVLCHTTSCLTLGFNFIFLKNIKQKMWASSENKEYCCNQETRVVSCQISSDLLFSEIFNTANSQPAVWCRLCHKNTSSPHKSDVVMLSKMSRKSSWPYYLSPPVSSQCGLGGLMHQAGWVCIYLSTGDFVVQMLVVEMWREMTAGSWCW